MKRGQARTRTPCTAAAQGARRVGTSAGGARPAPAAGRAMAAAAATGPVHWHTSHLPTSPRTSVTASERQGGSCGKRHSPVLSGLPVSGSTPKRPAVRSAAKASNQRSTPSRAPAQAGPPGKQQGSSRSGGDIEAHAGPGFRAATVHAACSSWLPSAHPAALRPVPCSHAPAQAQRRQPWPWPQCACYSPHRPTAPPGWVSAGTACRQLTLSTLAVLTRPSALSQYRTLLKLQQGACVGCCGVVGCGVMWWGVVQCSAVQRVARAHTESIKVWRLWQPGPCSPGTPSPAPAPAPASANPPAAACPERRSARPPWPRHPP